MSWYDRREELECAAKVHTRWSYSEDGGQSFVPSVRLSTEPVDLLAIRSSTHVEPWMVGDYMALEAIGDEVQAFWAQPLPRTSAKYDLEGDLWSAVIRSDTPTPVLMPVAGFRADVEGNTVRLGCELMEAPGALAVTGFRVERAAGESMEYAPLGSDLLPARGAGPYEMVDREVTVGKRYHYRLEVVLAGGSLWQGPVEVELPGASARLAWQWASPNPFTDSIVLELAIPHAARGVVAVYTATGREVTRLHQGWLAPGLQSLRWDGRDRRGRVVPAGIYLVRAVVGDAAVTRRVARIQ